MSMANRASVAGPYGTVAMGSCGICGQAICMSHTSMGQGGIARPQCASSQAGIRKTKKPNSQEPGSSRLSSSACRHLRRRCRSGYRRQVPRPVDASVPRTPASPTFAEFRQQRLRRREHRPDVRCLADSSSQVVNFPATSNKASEIASKNRTGLRSRTISGYPEKDHPAKTDTTTHLKSRISTKSTAPISLSHRFR